MGDAPDAAAPRAWALLEVLWDLALQRCAEGWLGGGEGVKGMVFCRDVSATCLLVNVAASKEKRLAIESRQKAENQCCQCYFFEIMGLEG